MRREWRKQHFGAGTWRALPAVVLIAPHRPQRNVCAGAARRGMIESIEDADLLKFSEEIRDAKVCRQLVDDVQ